MIHSGVISSDSYLSTKMPKVTDRIFESNSCTIDFVWFVEFIHFTEFPLHVGKTPMFLYQGYICLTIYGS